MFALIAIQPALLGFAALFTVLGLGMLALARVRGIGPGPGWWGLSFLSNGLGFSLWSAISLENPRAWFMSGEVAHMLAFWSLAAGAMRFTGRGQPLNCYLALLATLAVTILAAWYVPQLQWRAGVAILLLRFVYMVGAGVVILLYRRGEAVDGRVLAGGALLAWGAVCLAQPYFWPQVWSRSLGMGIMVALHVGAILGMVIMILDRLRHRAEAGEERATRLEGLLPICANCKKIRTPAGDWQPVEDYIRSHSRADFSHGLCDDCVGQLYPEVARSLAVKAGR